MRDQEEDGGRVWMGVEGWREGGGEATVSLSSNFGLEHLVSLSTQTLVFLIQDDKVVLFLRARRAAVDSELLFIFLSSTKPSYVSLEKLLLQSFTSCSIDCSRVVLLKDEVNILSL